MRLNSLIGKINQLRQLNMNRWPGFVAGWLGRKESNIVPCVLSQGGPLIQVPLRDFYESYTFFCEVPQGRKELDFFLQRLKPNDVFYDIGGFRGAYSAAAKSKLGDAILVHIFEPLTKNLEQLKILVQLNQFSGFQINALAVGDGKPVVGTVNEEVLVLRLGEVLNSAGSQFKSISLDEYIAAGNVPPSVIKIDVDGFELQVLNGARKCLQQNRPRIWLEVHPTFLKNQGKSVDDVFGILKESNYTFEYFTDYSEENKVSYHVWCV